MWISEERIPGLAMTRSVGDNIATSIGVSNEADISEIKTGKYDQIIIIASDGLWDYISSQEAIEIASKFWGSVELAARELLSAAEYQWKLNEECIDDITIIVIFLPFVSNF